MRRQAQAPTVSLSPEEFEAELSDLYPSEPAAPTEGPAGATPLSPEEFEAGFADLYPETPGPLGALAGSALEGLGNAAEAGGLLLDFMGGTKPANPGGMRPLTAADQRFDYAKGPQLGEQLAAPVAGAMRSGAEVVYPQESRGRGGFLSEDLPAGVGSTLGALPGAVAGPGGFALAAGAQIGVPLYHEVLEKTGDKEKAVLGLLFGEALGALETVGAGAAAMKVARNLAKAPAKALEGWAWRKVLQTGATETGQEMGEQGLVDLAQEGLTGEDLDNLGRIVEVAPTALGVGLLSGGAAKLTSRAALSQAAPNAPGARQAPLAPQETPAPPMPLASAEEAGAASMAGGGTTSPALGVSPPSPAAPVEGAVEGVAEVAAPAPVSLAPSSAGMSIPQGEESAAGGEDATLQPHDLGAGPAAEPTLPSPDAQSIEEVRAILEQREPKKLGVYAHTPEPAANSSVQPGDTLGPVEETEISALREFNPKKRTEERKVREIEAAMREGKPFPPVIASRGEKGDLVIDDGSHRIEAAKRIGHSKVPVRIVGAPKTPEAAAVPRGDRASVPSRGDPAAPPASPAWVTEEIDRRVAEADKLGVADEIEALSAERLTAKEVAARLVGRTGTADPKDLVLAVRAKRGIPSMDDRAAFEAWIAERKKPAGGVVELFAGGPSPVKSAPLTTSKVKKALRRLFVSEGHAPISARREIEIGEGAVKAEVIELSRNAKALDRAMRAAHGKKWQALSAARDVDAAFEGDGAALARLPEEAQAAVADMRAHLDRLIRSQVKEGGVVDPKAAPEFAKKILASQGHYARRSYRAHIDPEWADKVPSDVAQRLFTLWQSWAKDVPLEEIVALKRKSLERPEGAKSALARRREINREIAKLPKGDPRIKVLRTERRSLKAKATERTEAAWAARSELVGRKRFKGTSDEEIQGEMASLLQEAKENADSPWRHLASGKLGRKDLSIYKRRKDIPAELRAFLGEIEDPIANYANSVVKIASVVAKHEAYTKIREQGLGAWLHKKPTGAHSARLSAENSPGLRPLEGLYTTPEIKEALAALKPSDMNPIIKGLMHVNAGIKWGKVLGQPWGIMRNLQGNLTISIANGHLPTWFRGAEWKAALQKGDIQELKRLTRLGVVNSGTAAAEWRDLQEAMKKTPEELALGARSPFTQAKEGVEQLFEAADNAPKIRGFYAEEAALVKAGYSVAEAESLAADRVRDLYPTRERMAAFFKGFRKQPLLGSYFAFKAEILRTTGNRLRLIAEELKSENPKVRAMGAKRAVGQIVAASAVPTMVYAINSLNGIDADEDKDRREFLPEWDQSGRILWLGGENEGEYLDFSDVDPFTTFMDPLALVMGGTPADEAIERWIEEEAEAFIGPSPILQLAIELKSKRKENGAPIDDRVEHFKKAIQPGVLASVERASKEGSPTSELGAAISGFRRYDFDVEKSLGFDVRRFGAEISDVTRVMNSRRKAEPGEEAEFKVLAEKERKSLFKDLSAKAQAAVRLGIPVSKVRQMLDASLSREVTSAILTGSYIPWKEKK